MENTPVEPGPGEPGAAVSRLKPSGWINCTGNSSAKSAAAGPVPRQSWSWVSPSCLGKPDGHPDALQLALGKQGKRPLPGG